MSSWHGYSHLGHHDTNTSTTPNHIFTAHVAFSSLRKFGHSDAGRTRRRLENEISPRGPLWMPARISPSEPCRSWKPRSPRPVSLARVARTPQARSGTGRGRAPRPTAGSATANGSTMGSITLGPNVGRTPKNMKKPSPTFETHSHARMSKNGRPCLGLCGA